MQTPTPRQRLEHCRAFQRVTDNGVVFDWDLAGPHGAQFILFRESHHTGEDLRAADAWLRRTRHAAQVQICAIDADATSGPDAVTTVTVAIFDDDCGTHVRVFRQPERATAWQLEIARRGWPRRFADEPVPDSQTLSARYFERLVHEESFAVHECTLEAA